MDPYIEACGLWEDFHQNLISEIQRGLAGQIPENYVARAGERAYVVLVEAEGKDDHLFQPDVGVTSRRPLERAAVQGEETAVAEAGAEGGPVLMRPFIATEFREAFVEVYELHPERRLVTCVEVLSPSNKRRGTAGWEVYLRKRQALLLGEASLVEIDLLRGGHKMPMLDPWPDSPYTLLVARRERAPSCRVWRAHFQHPLPDVPVPLSYPDPPVTLSLQSMVEAIYARSRYAQDIDYTRPLQPALRPEEAAWLAEQLRSRGAP
jgi:hypothetical protein